MTTAEKLDAAIALHRDGAFDEAEVLYEAILTADPDNHQALSVSAILENQRGRSAEARRRLERAIEIAPHVAGYHNNLGNLFRLAAQPEKALDCYQEAARLDPGNIETLCNVGTLCRRLGLTAQARDLLEAVRAEAPDHPETNHNLAMIYAALDMETEALDCIEACHAKGVSRVVQPTFHARVLHRYGRRESAISLLERYREARPDDPEIAYELKSLRGDPSERAPDDYVRKHFNDFAEGFDQQLEILQYQAPKLVGEAVRGILGGNRVRLILDLGCGTGLLGEHLKPCCDTLIGVDLSPRMLVFAQRRNLYDKLGEVELTEALRSMPEGSVDLATAADTLCYFGTLDGVFAGLRQALRPGGAFVGTVEWHDGDDGPQILSSGRYSHGTPYVEATASANGLALRSARVETLRMEFGEPVRGLVFALENSG